MTMLTKEHYKELNKARLRWRILSIGSGVTFVMGVTTLSVLLANPLSMILGIVIIFAGFAFTYGTCTTNSIDSTIKVYEEMNRE